MPGKDCMAPGCLHTVHRGHLMCSEHWAKVPEDIKREVYKRLTVWRRPDLAREYLKNSRRAMDAVRVYVETGAETR